MKTESTSVFLGCFITMHNLLLHLYQALLSLMPLKYQQEIDNFGLDIDCPTETYPPDKQEAFRFSYDPIEHEHNFLPNVVFDRVTGNGVKYDRMPAKKKCSRCGASYYTKLEYAKAVWASLTEQLGEKFKLTYTHIAEGVLEEADGVMKRPDSYGHFSFYESDTADLAKQFKNVAQL